MLKQRLLPVFVLLGVVTLGWPAAPAHARIAVEAGFEGTVVITFPNGEIALIETGDAVPDIPTESTIEVFDGHLTVSTEAGDKVSLSCLDSDASVGGGGSAGLSCGADSGTVKALKGAVTVIDAEGQESQVAEGTEYAIKPTSPDTAPPTAAAEPIGGEPAGGDLAEPPPVDSRSLESSPQ